MTEFYSRDLTTNSKVGAVVLVTIGDPAADISPDSRPCVSCLIQQKSGTQIYATQNETASASSWKLSSTTPIPVPVANLNQLHFYGTAGDIAQIWWRG